MAYSRYNYYPIEKYERDKAFVEEVNSKDICVDDLSEDTEYKVDLLQRYFEYKTLKTTGGKTGFEYLDLNTRKEKRRVGSVLQKNYEVAKKRMSKLLPSLKEGWDREIEEKRAREIEKRRLRESNLEKKTEEAAVTPKQEQLDLFRQNI
jgi:hypothetical protein